MYGENKTEWYLLVGGKRKLLGQKSPIILLMALVEMKVMVAMYIQVNLIDYELIDLHDRHCINSGWL